MSAQPCLSPDGGDHQAPNLGLRDRLLLAAVDVFATSGYHGATTRQITTKAAVSSAALYVHYQDKADLLFQINLRGHEDVRRAVREAVDAATNPVDRFLLLVSSFVLWHARNSKIARVIQYELPAIQGEAYNHVARIRREIEDDFRTEVETICHHFGTEVDVVVTARALLSMGIDVARWFRPDRVVDVDDLARQYALMALAVVACPQDAALPTSPQSQTVRRPSVRSSQ